MDDPSASRPGFVTRLLQRAVDVKESEVRALLWSCAYFFCLLSGYFILRPLREEVGIAGGMDKLAYLWTGTLCGMAVANPIFSFLVSRHPRRKFIPWVHRFFAANLILFYLLLRLFPEHKLYIGRGFYIWLSVFNLFVVSLFWGFMADIFKLDQGKRLFGFIGVGGTLGAIAGSWFTGTFVKQLGAPQLLLVSVVLLEASMQCFFRLIAMSTAREAREADRAAGSAASARLSAPALAAGPKDRPQGGAFSGIALVFKMPYLRGIGLYTIFYTLSAGFLYFWQGNIVTDAVKDSAERTALFAHIDLYVSSLTLLMQFFATGRIVVWLGITFTLVAQPVLTTLGFTTLGLTAFLPALPNGLARAFEWVFGLEPHAAQLASARDPRLLLALCAVVIFQVLFRSVNQGTAKPAREMLYTVVDREVKYKSKSFIDTFVYRSGDLVASWTFTFLHTPAMLGIGLTAIAFGTVPLGVLWLVTGLLLGRKQEEMARKEAVGAQVPEGRTAGDPIG
jgi:AAA family ATP:ADP antiporter